MSEGKQIQRSVFFISMARQLPLKRLDTHY
jgi:hypothetical protein